MLGPGSMVDEIVNITAMAVFESQSKSKNNSPFFLQVLETLGAIHFWTAPFLNKIVR